MKFRKICEV